MHYNCLKQPSTKVEQYATAHILNGNTSFMDPVVKQKIEDIVKKVKASMRWYI